MPGAIAKIRANLVPKVTMGGTVVLLLLRLTVGWGLFDAGTGKIHKLFGTCATDPLPECESEAIQDCGENDACKLKVPAQCDGDRQASCKEQGERAIEWFGTLTIAGVDGFGLPGGGKLNFAMAGFTEAIFGLLLLIGLLTRLTAVPLLGTMTVAMLTAHWQSIGLDLAFVSELAFVYWVCLAVVIGLGPGNFSIDRMLAK